MISVILTIDYELFGNGQGDLINHVYKPTEKFTDLLDKYNYKFVNFVEVAEFLTIKRHDNSENIKLIENQINKLHTNNHEIGLHIHPQWFNAQKINGIWELDFLEYNLGKLDDTKIETYLSKSISYLKEIIDDKAYQPISFRAGNWLIQPSLRLTKSLSEKGLLLDSSVFKGGYDKSIGIDFRTIPNKPFWKFKDDILIEDDAEGVLFEIPIYSKNMSFIKLFSSKRMKTYHQMNSNSSKKSLFVSILSKFRHLKLSKPIKFDLSKQTAKEMISYIKAVEIAHNPSDNIPLVAIGHTKNLSNFKDIEALFEYLKLSNINVETFKQFLNRIQ